MDEECFLKAKIGRKEILKEKLDAKRVCIQTGEDISRDVGRTRDVVNKEKENVDAEFSTEDVLSTAQQKEKDSTDRTYEGTDDQTEGRRDTQTTQTTTSTMFGDDETIAQVLLNMSQAKAVSREKRRKGGIPEAEKKFKQLASDEEMARKLQEDWETEEERKRLAEEEATNDAFIRNYDDIKVRIEADRLLAERLQKEEREQFTVEERAKFLHDTIAAQRRFLVQQRSEAIRNKPPTKNQLRNRK
ncbi:hypothetical protein Tco_0894763 [Tanacetum coccineum]|uniref:Uncharacterized protein n=1 Tax=Tanacetum coccineum TaxID=301880 RepID=A0ABQ5CFY1_9ASTR